MPYVSEAGKIAISQDDWNYKLTDPEFMADPSLFDYYKVIPSPTINPYVAPIPPPIPAPATYIPPPALPPITIMTSSGTSVDVPGNSTSAQLQSYVEALGGYVVTNISNATPTQLVGVQQIPISVVSTPYNGANTAVQTVDPTTTIEPERKGPNMYMLLFLIPVAIYLLYKIFGGKK